MVAKTTTNACQWSTSCHAARVTEERQVHASMYRTRLPLVVADFGSDDVMVGGEILEKAKSGFGTCGRVFGGCLKEIESVRSR